jgi:LuxR family maltose regulon positive regulatory protein
LEKPHWVCNWIRKHKVETAWYSLDKGDNDSTIFLSYLIASIQQTDNGMGKSYLPLLQASRPDVIKLLTDLIGDITLSGREKVLVLEDYHFIRSEEIHSGIEFLIDHKPSNLHLVIITEQPSKIINADYLLYQDLQT